MTRTFKSRAPSSTRPVKARKPQASRIAFLSSAFATTEVGESVFVQSLCWPTVPTAWIELTQSLNTLCSGRDSDPSTKLPSLEKFPSWIRNCAPQLAAPFRNTATAEDSSIAALLSRAPMQIAIAIIDLRDGHSLGMHQRALSQCLAVYNESLQLPCRESCTLLVSRSQAAAIDQQQLDALAKCKTHMPGAHWLKEMQLQFWSEPPEPIPLELSQLVATAAARYALDDEASLPLIDAILTKLVHNPFQRTHRAARRR